METQQIEGLIEYVEDLQGSQTTDEEIILYRRLRNALDTKLKNLFSESENEVKLSMFDLSVGAVAEAAAVMAVGILERKYGIIEVNAKADDEF